MGDTRGFWFHKRHEDDVSVMLNGSDVNYLTGLRDASSGSVRNEFQVLLEAIKKHGSIKVWERY